MSSIQLVKAVDAADTPAERRRAARAYRTGLKDGQDGEAKRAAMEAELYRRGLAAVLDVLGDALIDEDRDSTVTWYGVLTLMVAVGR